MSIHKIARCSILPPAMVAVAVFVFFCGLIFPGSSQAAIQKTIHIQWSYDTSQPGLAGYRIYQDNQLLQEIDDPQQLSADLVASFTTASASFTMTAFDTSGNESAPSSPYVVTLDSSVTSPVATIAADTLTGTSPLTVHFDGSQSSGGVSTIVAWNWDFGDGTTASGSAVDHVFTAAGIYPVTLTVTDANSDTAVSHTTVTVATVASSGNLLPIADIKTDSTSGTVPFTVQFDASSSLDEDGTIVSYDWDFGDGTSQSGESVSHSYSVSGTYTVTLTVTDDEGGVGKATTVIDAAGTDGTVNAKPVAAIAADATTGIAPFAVSFDGGNSSDLDGSIVAYAWDFGDGTTSTGSFCQHQFTSPGTYTVQLTVTDDQGATGTTSVNVVVLDPNSYKTYSGGVTVNGAAIPGIQVEVLDSSQNIVGTCPVENGTFTTDPLPNGSYTFLAVYGTEQTAVFADQTTDWKLTLHSLSGSIAGIGGDGTGTVLIIAYSQKAKLMAGIKVQDLNNTTYTINNLLPADDYVVSATALNKPILYYAGALSQGNATPVDLTGGDVGAVNFDFSSTGGAPVSGNIVLNGSAAADVPVYAYEINTSAMQLTFTAADGSYSLSLADGDYILFSVINGRTNYFTGNGVNQNLSQAGLVTIAGGAGVSGVDFNIVTCSYNLSGTVTDVADSQAVAGALVTAQGSQNVASTYTDANGHYVVSGICADTYSVYMDPRLQNYPVQMQKVDITSSDATGIDFTINSGHTVSGTVTNAADSQPLSGTKVYLENDLTGELFGSRFFYTDQQGNYVIHDIPTGNYSLHFNNANFESKVVSGLDISGDLVENASLSAGGYVWGYVKDQNGLAIPDRLVLVQGSDMPPVYGKTDANGQFTIRGLPLDTPLQILVSRGANEGYQISGSTVTATANGTKVEIIMVAVEQTFALSGTVRSGCDQSPLANAEVVAYYNDANTKFFKVTWTDANGAYNFQDLPVAVNYELAVIPGAGQQATVISGIDGASSAYVVQDVEMVCGQSIAGNVSIGNISTPVYAILFDSNHNFVDYVTLQNTGQAGSYPFSFDNLPAGEYKLVLSSSGMTPVWYNNASTFDQATALQPGGAAINMTFGQ